MEIWVSKFEPILAQLAVFFTSLNGTISISLAILLIAVVVYVLGFYRETEHIKKQLKIAIDKISHYENKEALVKSFEEFNEWIAHNAILEKLWKEFSETLIFPRSIDEKQTIYATQPPSMYFNDQTLLLNRVNLDFYKTFPNYLTGGGILGTFLGLAFGIYLAHKGLASDNVRDITTALGSLLGGASIAFCTSIAGLITSIFFSFFEKRRTHGILNLIARWNQYLGDQFSLLTLEKIANDNLHESRKQRHQLEIFNTDLAVSIASALDEKIAGRLGPSLDKLIDSVEKLREERGQTSEKLLINIVEEFKKSLSETTGFEMKAVVDTLQKLDNSLLGTVKAISQGQEEINKVTDSIGVNIQNMIENSSDVMFRKIGELLQEMSDKLTRVTENAAKSLREAGTETSSAIIRSTDGFTESVKNLIETIEHAKQFMESATDNLREMKSLADVVKETHVQIGNLITPLVDISTRLEEAGNRAQEAMYSVKQYVGSLENTGKHFEITTTRLVESWDEYRKRFQNVDSSLKNIFKEINDGLERYTEQIRKFVLELDRYVGSAIKDIGGAIGELTETVENLVEVSGKMSQ